MKTIEQEAKDVDTAVQLALEKLEVQEDKVDVEVIEEGQKGLFGILGSKNAKVKVTIKEDKGQKAFDFLSEILSLMNLEADAEVLEKESDYVLLNITGPNLGIVIGRRGKTLDALQYLVSLAINKNGNDYYRILLDAEGYRKRRKDTLQNLAMRLADKAKKKKTKVVLEPMPAHERRIIHISLKDDIQVETYSEGEEPYRKVIIDYRGN